MRKATSSLIVILISLSAAAQTQVDINQQVRGMLKPSNGGVGAAPAGADATPISTSTTTAAWSFIPNCPNDGAHAITYSTATHSFNCGSVSGTAGSPAGRVNQIQINGTASFAASNATLDAAGDLVAASYGGTPDANALNESGIGTNDAIANILSTPNASITVNDGYTTAEGTFSAPYRQPSFVGNTPFSTFSGFANNTYFNDFRNNSYGMFWNNPPQTAPAVYNSFYTFDHLLPSGGGDWQPQQDSWMILGGGRDSVDGFQTVHHFKLFNMMDLSQGISDNLNMTCFKFGRGDHQCEQIVMENDGATETGGDEGGELHRDELSERPQIYFGTASGNATGATFINMTKGTQGAFPGEGNPAVFPALAQAVTHVTTDTPRSFSGTFGFTTGQWVVEDSRTPDIIGRISADIDITAGDDGSTTVASVAMSNLTGAISPASPLCIGGDGTPLESATINSCQAATGTSPNISQTCSVNLNLPHVTGGYVSQGANACMGYEVLANQFANGTAAPHRNMVRTIGRSSANTVLYTALEEGLDVDAFNFDASALVVFNAGDTLSRNANTVSVNSSVPIVGGFQDLTFLNNDCVDVVGAADATFNGKFCNLIATGTTVTWSNPGANTTTTTTKNGYIVAPNGFDSNAVQAMPMYRIVIPYDFATKQVDGPITIEPNNITVANGSTVEAQHGFSITNRLYHGEVDHITVPSAGNREAQIDLFYGGNIPPGESAIQVNNSMPTTHYFGAGGTQFAGTTLIQDNSTEPFLNSWITGHGLFGINSGIAFQMTDCGPYACDNPLYNPTMWLLIGNEATYAEEFHPSNQDAHLQTIFDSNILMQDHNLSISTGNTDSMTGFFSSAQANWGPATFNINLVVGGTNADITADQVNGFVVHSGGLTGLPGGFPSHFDLGSTVLNAAGTPELICTVDGNNCKLPPIVPDTETVNQASCIKALGPPVVIGFCSTVVSATGSCTCN